MEEEADEATTAEAVVEAEDTVEGMKSLLVEDILCTNCLGCMLCSIVNYKS